MKKKNKIYHVEVSVTIETILPIAAESYETALQKARELGPRDVVDFETDYGDGSIKVIGIWNKDEEPSK